MGKRSTGFFLFGGGIVVLAACGGSARLNSVGGGGAASGGAAPSAGAGNGSAGGDVPGASGSGAAGSSAGTALCSLAKEAGPCDAYQPSFWHNPKTGLCEPFIYGGCGGNANRFASRNACLVACPGGDSAWGACRKDSDCTLTTLGCCGGCEPLADHDYLALNAAHVAEEFDSRPCTPVPACAPCPPGSETTDTGKYQKPVCLSGQCSALDIRSTPLTECEANGDCVLRAGVACCQQCNGGFVSVNATSNFCPDGQLPCPKCASIPPVGVVAGCVEKRCVELPTR